MLLSFEVENFRSIKERTVFQMTAINYYKENENQLINAVLPGLQKMRFLRAATIFGPNAAGKTSLWRALGTMREIVQKSATITPDKGLPYKPFFLDESSKSEPTYFSVTFTSGLENNRFEYSFSYNKTDIISESLIAYPKGSAQTWFLRSLNEEGEIRVKKSPYLRIPSALNPLVNSNTLILSLLANYPNFKQSEAVLSLFNWFCKDLDLYSRAPETQGDALYSQAIIKGETGSEFQRKFILDIIKSADIGISDIKIEEEKIPEEIVEVLKKFSEDLSERDTVDVALFRHNGSHVSNFFPYVEESDGTQQLFGLSGHISRALERGSVLFVDELDASLHPIIVGEIVNLFLIPETNPNNAQLIFTAHNPCVLDMDLLRRDQIWFAEKDDEGGTHIYPLSDYSPRKNEAVAAGYLAGKYSAIPVVPRCLGFFAGGKGSDIDKE